LTGVCLLVIGGLAAVMGKGAVDEKGEMSYALSMSYNIAVLPFLWPSLALYLKRIHDFGQGRGGLWPALILVALFYGLDWANYERAVDALTVFAAGLVVVVGCIKGTSGPNQYGPDPLANVSRKSTT
jgi:uncharacterized membrane protein YhaH (DUF805 family)